jgi:hypothetical protein
MKPSDAQTQMLLTIILHALPKLNHAQDSIQLLISQHLARHRTPNWRTLIPPKSNRDFFVENEKTAIIVLHIHLEVFVSPSASPLNLACASKTMLFYKFPHVRH